MKFQRIVWRSFGQIIEYLLSEVKVFTSNSKAYQVYKKFYRSFEAVCQQQPANHPPQLARRAIFGSKSGKEPPTRNFSSCLWILRPLRSHSQAWVATPKHWREKVPMNRPVRSTQSTTWSASSINIPRPVDWFDPKLDCQKGEGLRRPLARYRVRSSIVSARVWIRPPWRF